MINDKIKELIDTKNKEQLKYILLDALSQDPTLVNYKDDIEYLNNVFPEFWDSHCELNPFDSSKNNEDLFYEVKSDLRENFSKKRFEYAQKLAMTVFADRIKTAAPSPQLPKQTTQQNPAPSPQLPKQTTQQNPAPPPQQSLPPATTTQTNPIDQKKKQNGLPLLVCLIIGTIVLIILIILLVIVF